MDVTCTFDDARITPHFPQLYFAFPLIGTQSCQLQRWPLIWTSGNLKIAVDAVFLSTWSVHCSWFWPRVPVSHFPLVLHFRNGQKNPNDQPSKYSWCTINTLDKSVQQTHRFAPPVSSVLKKTAFETFSHKLTIKCNNAPVYNVFKWCLFCNRYYFKIWLRMCNITATSQEKFDHV